MYVTVNTQQGTLGGQEKTSEYFSRRKYYSFQGIPFAKPPLGPLRFKDPEEPEVWSGVRDALKEGDDCSQIHQILCTPVGSEDCLYLNVYTPKLNNNGELPVLVWIHGGGFLYGSGSTELHGPDYLIEQDLVLVTVNYRLGVLGFLCLDHEEAPGNAGLKDQVMALRWIKKNIAQFGGDPNKVTIFGESAGAACVHYLILSPLSQGLFQQAILQSGSALNQWALADRSVLIDRAFSLGKILGCDTTDTSTLLEFLRNVPVKDFLTTVDKVIKGDEPLYGMKMKFLPCVEEPVTSHSFLPALPRELLKQGNFAKIPIIIGSTSAEGVIGLEILNLSENNITEQYEMLEKSIIQGLGLSEDSDEAKQILKEIKQFYFGDEPITMKKLDNFIEFYGDLLFDYGIDETLRIKLETEEAPSIYAYEFTDCLSNSFVKLAIQTMIPGVKYKGVSHAEDVSLFFNSSFRDLRKNEPEDEDFIAKMTKMWAAFTQTGNPNYSGMEIEWEPVKKNCFCHLDIGKKLRLVPERVKEKRMNLWQQIYDRTSCLKKEDFGEIPL